MNKLQPWFHGLIHGVVALVVYAVPLLLAQNQQIADLTVSSIVLWGLHWLENAFATTP